MLCLTVLTFNSLGLHIGWCLCIVYVCVCMYESERKRGILQKHLHFFMCVREILYIYFLTVWPAYITLTAVGLAWIKESNPTSDCRFVSLPPFFSASVCVHNMLTDLNWGIRRHITFFNRIAVCLIPLSPSFCSSHPTSCCSVAEIMSVLFFHTMKYRPEDPRNPNNDRFILSKVTHAHTHTATWFAGVILIHAQRQQTGII